VECWFRLTLALGMFSVGDSVSDDGLEEGLKDATSFFVDHLKDMSVSW
jgi:hypothetical protein